MDQVLQGIPNINCYLEDIMVTEQSDEEHDARGLHRTPEKGQTIAEDLASSNGSKLLTLLCTTNNYGGFIPSLASIPNPMNTLLCQGRKQDQ